MKIYHNCIINQKENTFSFYTTNNRVYGSANDALKKIEYILTHFKDLTYKGSERDVHLKLKGFAATIVTQYRAKESKIHWLIRIIFCCCIGLKWRQVAGTYARIEALSDPSPPLPPPPLPLPKLPPSPPAPPLLPCVKPPIVEKRFTAPFNGSQDTLFFMFGYLDYRSLSNFCAGNKQMHALTEPFKKKVEWPVRGCISQLKTAWLETYWSWERHRELYKAAESGQVQQLFGHLLLGANPNEYRDEIGDRALHWTVYRGDLAGTTILLKYHARVDEPGYQKGTPFIQAYRRYVHYNGNQPVYLEIMKRLLEKGAHPNQRVLAANSPVLHQAIRDRRPQVVELLLAAKADPKAMDGQGYAALHVAALTGDVALARLILDARASIDQPTGKQAGESPLFCAYSAPQGQPRHDMMRFLLENRADPNLNNQQGGSLLAEMAYRAERGLLELLIAHKGDVNLQHRRFTTLGWACGGANNYTVPFMPSVPLIHFLLQVGAEPRLLMAGRADNGQLNGQLAVEIADANGHRGIADVLWKRMPRLHRAIYRGDIDRVRALLDENAKVNRPYGPGAAGETPLWYAYRICPPAQRRAMMQLLLSRGANPNTRNSREEVLVDHMVDNGQRDLLEMMINSGAEINQLRNGKTTLGWACFNRPLSMGIIRLLLERGADPFIVQKDGLLPLAYVQDNEPATVLLHHRMGL